jgi:hypothetical protein
MINGRVIFFQSARDNLIRLISCMAIPIIVVIIDLIPKTNIGFRPFPLLLNKLKSLKRIPVLSPNQIGNDYCD